MADADKRVLIYGVEEIIKTAIFLRPYLETLFWNVTVGAKNSGKALKWSDAYYLN